MHAEHLKTLHQLPPYPAIVAGILLLFVGRKLFWLFVGVLGFVVGAEVAAALFPHQPDWAIIGALILGLIGAMLAIFVQKAAISIAGFLAGGYFLMTLLRSWEMHAPEYSWISFLIGGVLGAVLMIVVFNWALIIFSSISGAHLIVHSLALSQVTASALFVGLVVAGILAQSRTLPTRESE